MPTSKEQDEGGKVKVAIIGGGCAGLTAAFELTRPEQKHRFQVTVYERGHCLGGKGASCRNAAAANRTEEHGLHVWMGFYENAFRVMRDCYAELAARHKHDPDARASLYADWRDVFIPDPYIGVADRSREGWRTWTAHFPPNPGEPGDPIGEDTNPFTLRSYLARSVDLLRALVRSTFSAGKADPEEEPNRVDFTELSPRAVVEKVTSVLRAGVFTSVGALYEGLSILKLLLSATTEPGLLDSEFKVLQYADAIADSWKKQTEDVFRFDESLRPKLELIELVVTVIVGILRDQLLSDPDGLDAINDEDCRDWLKRHGASPRALNSPIVRALYDMAFVGERVGDPLDGGPPGSEPGLAAGQALRGALRMFFTYRGALFWKLRAGMGDVVFSPLYEVLKLRGVKFEFFHSLADIQPGADGRHIESLKFQVSHELKKGRPAPSARDKLPEVAKRAYGHEEYYPLDVDGCWPKEIQSEQVTKKDTESTLSVSKQDFHFVVLAIGGGALRLSCNSLITRDRRFAAMVDNLKTTRTQALQLWLNEGLEVLCNPPEKGDVATRPQLPTPITVAGFEPPFDTWSDMTHVLAQERWSPRPKGLAYFCGVLPDPNQSDDETLDAAIRFLDESLPQLWPGARDDKTHGFRWELLAGGGSGRAESWEDKRRLLLTQYVKASTKGSDEYVLSRPGTLHYRISPLDDTYDNFTVAGDWTDAGFNEGCVEAAMMSGRLASHALSAFPALEDIIGYDHP